MSFFCGMERTEYSGFFLIAADYRWMNLLQKLLQLPLTKGASTCAYRIEDDRMTKLIGSLPGKNALGGFCAIRRSWISGSYGQSFRAKAATTSRIRTSIVKNISFALT